MLMEEVVYYIGRKSSYRAYIQRSLEKKMSTGFLSTTRTTRNEDNGEISRNQNKIARKV